MKSTKSAFKQLVLLVAVSVAVGAAAMAMHSW
jgi:hypothetical protein